MFRQLISMIFDRDAASSAFMESDSFIKYWKKSSLWIIPYLITSPMPDEN